MESSPIPVASPLPIEVIELAHATKRFGEREAVAGLSLTVREPECFGLLGPNGAGKTTLMRMLQGATPVTSGTVKILGRDVTDRREARVIRSLVGVVPQEDNLDTDLTVRENLILYAHFYGIMEKAAAPRADELLEWVRLSDRRNDSVSDLSGGLRRRLTLARALIHKPRLLILDEPTTGLDPQARLLIWDKVRELRKGFVTVLLSTHDMDEAEALCTRLVVMDAGKVLAEDEPLSLVRSRLAEHCIAITPASPVTPEQLAPLRKLARLIEHRGEEILFFTDDPRALTTALAEIPRRRLRERPADLEDLFVALTGRELRE